jgi:hypothetical protein
MTGMVTKAATKRMISGLLVCCVGALIFPARPGLAQDGGPPTIEGFGGWAGFVDDVTINHWVIGAGGRYYITPRIGVGPEFVYMSGPGSDRDLMLTGNVTFDILAPTTSGMHRANPFVVLGGGIFQHRERFESGEFTSTEGAFTGGGGVRLWLNDRVYVAPELRIGWELHTRATLAVGVRLGR